MNTISKTAVIHNGVIFGKNVTIKDFVVIYPNVEIGDDVVIMENSVIGRAPRGTKANNREVHEEYKKVSIGNGTVISPGVIIYSDVIIGSHTLVGDNASIREQCVIGDFCIISRSVTINYNTKIGNRTKIMDNSHITGNMIIGNNVFISVCVSTTNDNNIGTQGYDEKKIIGPTICDNVLVGAAANILPGLIIGKGSIIGASALVTKNVPEHKVVMGVPGKIVRDVLRKECD